MARFIFDFVGITDLTFLSFSDIVKALFMLYAGLYALRLIIGFISSIFPSGKNSVFRGM